MADTSSPPAGAGSAEPQGLQGWLRRWLPLLAWVAVALLLRWAVVEPRWIPSGSMLPTLQLQDRILVEKVRPHLGKGLPYGAIVVFHAPPALVEGGYDPKAALIKRVIGPWRSLVRSSLRLSTARESGTNLVPTVRPAESS